MKAYITNCRYCDGLGYIPPKDPDNPECNECSGCGRFKIYEDGSYHPLKEIIPDRDFSWSGEGRGISFGKDDRLRDLWLDIPPELREN